MIQDHDTSAQATCAFEQLLPLFGPPLDVAVPPLRLLGPKATTLHARRQRRAVARTLHWLPRPGAPTTEILASEDGSLDFTLRSTTWGLCIERTDRSTPGALIQHYFVLNSLSSFRDWCDADPVRFTCPLLYSQLRHHGDVNFDRHS